MMKSLVKFSALVLMLVSCVQKPAITERKVSSDGADQVQKAEFVVPAGTLRAHISWTVDTMPPNNDVARALIEFEPDNSAKNLCPQIRFIQTARVEKTAGVDYQWDHFEKNRTLVRTEKTQNVEPGYFVDHLSDNCKKGTPCSPFFRDHWMNADESQDGYKKSAQDKRKASLIDYPFGWTEFEKISAEACAYCPANRQFYGCVKWNARWPLMGPRELAPVSFSAAPSKTFAAALKKFAAFYLPIK